METINPVLNPQQNSDGTRTLRLRFILNRRISYKSLFKISPRYYNEVKNVVPKTHPKAEKEFVTTSKLANAILNIVSIWTVVRVINFV